MGVWIETSLLFARGLQVKSHPVWVCGLKLPYPRCRCTACCHTLYGCVD